MPSEAAKQPADDVTGDEPNSKKVKISEHVDTAKDVQPDIVKKSDVKGNNVNKTGVTDLPKAANGNNVANDEELGEDDDEHDDEGNGVFNPKIANILENVESLQLEIMNLNEKASEEILKVEQKFNKLRRPHFEKRNELLKEIPNFWLTSMANHPTIAPMIESAEDEDCLHYLVNLDVEEHEDIKSGYTLKLNFSENPYIVNNVVVKQFQVVSSDDIVSTVSPRIEYKNTPQGQKLKQIVEESIANYRRSRRPGQMHQSFFAWLFESSDSSADEVAETIKDQIWPNPLEFYFATPEDYSAGSDESEDEDEEIDDEEIDDDEEPAEIADIDGEFSEEDIEGDEEEDDAE